MKEVYTLQDIQHNYNRHIVLDIPHLSIPEESITGVFGPNGSGKSTLLRLLAFVEEPSQGKIFFCDKPSRAGDINLRRQVSLLDQSPYLLKRSVQGFVGFGLKVRGITKRKEKVKNALHMVGLEPEKYMKRMWFQLSGGEAQRVALASRLVLRPKVLLLDEPTASLDSESTQRIRSAALLARKKWGTTIVLVSHDHSWLQSVSDLCFFMQEGQITDLSNIRRTFKE